MIHFVDATIPLDTARKLAIASDPRTSADPGYVVKAALNEAFGEHAVRPWRLMAQYGVHRVIGVVDDAKAVKPNTMSRRLGIVTELLDHGLDDDVLSFDVEAAPMRRLSLSGSRERGIRRWGSVVAEVIPTGDGDFRLHETRDDETRRIGYGRWLCMRLGEENTGLELVDYPEIVDMRWVRHNRRIHAKGARDEDSIRVHLIPRVRARVSARISDLDMASRFIRSGIGKMKDVGMGSVLPVEILEAVTGSAS